MIFIHAARDPAHNNGRETLPRKVGHSCFIASWNDAYVQNFTTVVYSGLHFFSI